MENKLDILREKVKKLLRLSQNNPNQEEAILAATKAQELITKYNIELGIWNENDNREITKKIVKLKKWKSWQIDLSGELSSNFRCFSAYNPSLKEIHFFGEIKDLIVLEEVFIFLFETGDFLANQKVYKFRKKFGSAVGIYKSYIQGFLLGIHEYMSLQTKALMIVLQKDVIDYYEKQKLRKSLRNHYLDKKAKNFDLESFMQGYKEGKEILDRKKLGQEVRNEKI